MARALIIGALIFLALIVARLPAGLLRSLVPEHSPVNLLDLGGTVWNGNGDLLVDGLPLGRLHWAFAPVTLMEGSLGYDLRLSGAGAELSGRVQQGLTSARVEAAGNIRASFVNQWLAPYHIDLSGNFQLLDVEAMMTGQTLAGLSGQIHWEGGPIQYRLSGNMHNSSLPAMIADLGPGPEATAHGVGEYTPMLISELKTNGFIRFGVTKYLTRLLGEPWPGGDPDHAVVLEVEEQVF